MGDESKQAGKLYPAHAGMNPDLVDYGYGAGALPRTRGDEPAAGR